jgi:hypothetical protein
MLLLLKIILQILAVIIALLVNILDYKVRDKSTILLREYAYRFFLLVEFSFSQAFL